MKRYNLPTRKECFEIIGQCRVPSHIVKHSLASAKLAVFLAQRLKANGVQVDIDLVDRACLLHDILRVCDFTNSDYSRFARPVTEDDKAKWRRLKAKYRGIPHEDAAFELLKPKYPKLALTVRKHRYMSLLDENERPTTWEEKLVYYADKRVMHDRIVPLKRRLEEAHKRNTLLHDSTAQSKLKTAKVDRLIFKLEEEIFGKIGMNPLEVTDGFIDSRPGTQIGGA
jgi:uncharacterized protein